MPEYWDKTPFIQIQKSSVKSALQLDLKTRYVSPQQLMENSHFQREWQELTARKEKKEKLSSYFLEIEKLEFRLSLYQAVRQGYLPLWLPQEDDSKPWLAARDLPAAKKEVLADLLKEYSKAVIAESEGVKPDTAFGSVLEQFQSFSPTHKKIQAEVFYNSLHPLRWSWVLYLAALVLFFALWLWRHREKVFFGMLAGGVCAAYLRDAFKVLYYVASSSPPICLRLCCGCHGQLWFFLLFLLV